jgi:formyl-CoA transferase
MAAAAWAARSRPTLPRGLAPRRTPGVVRVAEIDVAIGDWTQSRDVVEVLDAMTAAQVPAGRIYTAKDIAEDPHYQARGMLQHITTEDGLSLEVPGVVPVLSATPGRIGRLAPALNADADEVLGAKISG